MAKSVVSAPGVVLACRGLRKSFGGVPAVDGFDFEVRQDELLGLIGPNGAGKSTVVNLIAGTMRPDAGSIVFFGHDVAGRAPHDRARLGIARTFQLTSPFQSLSVLENVAVGALFAASGGKLARAEAFELAGRVLEDVGLWPKRAYLGSQLTVADRKRLELARALAMRPKLLLLDEVMSGLNPREIDELLPVIRKVHGSGVAMLVIEHVMRAIAGLSARVVVMHQGRLLATGTPAEIAANPAVIREYLGARYSELGGPSAGIDAAHP